MRIRVIDDKEQFAKALCARFDLAGKRDCTCVTVFGDNDALTLSDEIIESLEFDSILFININVAIGKEKRQTYKGIELLTWLRIKGVMNHCVLYSFQPLYTIARADKKNLVLFSKGTDFIQLPNDFSNIDLNQLKEEIANKENLKVYLKPSFSISEFHHRDANWWGVKQLWDVHRLVTFPSKLNYPAPIYNKFQSMESMQAINLYTHPYSNLNIAYEDAKNEIEELRSILLKRYPRVLHIDDQWRDGWSETFIEIIYPSNNPSKANNPNFYTLSSEGKKVFHIYKNFNEDNVKSISERVQKIYESIKSLYFHIMKKILLT